LKKGKMLKQLMKIISGGRTGADRAALDTAIKFKAAGVILKSFILENRIEILNVAGPRLSNNPGIYQDVKIIIETVSYMLFFDSSEDKFFKTIKLLKHIIESFPSDITEAVEIVAQDLTLKFKMLLPGWTNLKSDIYISHAGLFADTVGV
jgi:hypothetical protein